jgi:hypothetical protein
LFLKRAKTQRTILDNKKTGCGADLHFLDFDFGKIAIKHAKTACRQEGRSSNKLKIFCSFSLS